MTTSNALVDINTFCALPIHISSILDSGGTEWFLLNTPLRAALELPEDFDHEEFLDRDECSRDLLEHADGKKEELSPVSETGLYKLLLQAVQPFKSWVLETVAPTLAEDSIYTMGEEVWYHAPEDYDLTHQEIWSGTLSAGGDAHELASLHLPMLRRDGRAEITCFILTNQQGENISLPDPIGARERKNERKRRHVKTA